MYILWPRHRRTEFIITNQVIALQTTSLILKHTERCPSFFEFLGETDIYFGKSLVHFARKTTRLYSLEFCLNNVSLQIAESRNLGLQLSPLCNQKRVLLPSLSNIILNFLHLTCFLCLKRKSLDSLVDTDTNSDTR